MNDPDDDVRMLVRGAGADAEPDDAHVAALKARVLDAVGDVSFTPVPHRAQRWPRAILAAAAAIVLVVVAVAIVRDDEPTDIATPPLPTTTPTTTPPTPTTVGDDDRALVDAIVDRTWVSLDGPARSAVVRFERAGDALVVDADDGCDAHVDAATVRLTGGVVSGLDLGADDGVCNWEPAVIPTPGVALAADGSELVLTDPAGRSTTYVALESLERSTADLTDGTWDVVGAPSVTVLYGLASTDDPTLRELAIAITRILDGDHEAWTTDRGVLVRTWNTGYYLLAGVESTGTPFSVDDGDIHPGPDDVLGTTLTGELVWIRRAEGREVGRIPLTTVTGDPARVQVLGLSHGSVLYLDGGDLWALAKPGGAPSRIVNDVSVAALSADGSRLAVSVGLPDGRQELRVDSTDGGWGLRRLAGEWGRLTWSLDGSHLYGFSSDGPMSYIDRIDVDQGPATARTIERYRQPFVGLGSDAAGNLVGLGRRHDEGSVVVATLDPQTLEPVDGPWNRPLPDAAPAVTLSSDGTRLVVLDWHTGDVTIESLDGTTEAGITGMASAVIANGEPSPPCTADQLDAAVRARGGAMGHDLIQVGFTNIGTTPCLLDGYPSVALLADGTAVPVDAAHGTYDGEPWLAAPIGPGEQAGVTVEGTNSPCGDASTWSGVRLTLPDGGGDVDVAIDDLDASCGIRVSRFYRPDMPAPVGDGATPDPSP